MSELPRPDGDEPRSCPNGHLLEPRTFLRGWEPCGCPSALAANGGHRRIHCLSCEAEGWTVISYRPYCSHRSLSRTS